MRNGKGGYRFKPCCSNCLLFFQVEDWSCQSSPGGQGLPWEVLSPWDQPCFCECILHVSQGLYSSQEKRAVQLHCSGSSSSVAFFFPSQNSHICASDWLELHRFIYMGCLSERGSHHLCLWKQALMRLYTLLEMSYLFLIVLVFFFCLKSPIDLLFTPWCVPLAIPQSLNPQSVVQKPTHRGHLLSVSRAVNWVLVSEDSLEVTCWSCLNWILKSTLTLQ